MATAAASKGLEGIVATTSSICWIDGDSGVLAYRGIDIHKLAEQSNFEETTYLLWNGRLPKAAELNTFRKELAKARVVDPTAIELLPSSPKDVTPMKSLRTALSSLTSYDPDTAHTSHNANLPT